MRWREPAEGRSGGRGAWPKCGQAWGWARRRGHAEESPRNGENWELALWFFWFIECWQLRLLKRRGAKVNFFDPDPWEL